MGISTKQETGNVLADGDYVANDGLWLSCQGASIRIVPGSEGISISVYREGEEMEESIVETWVTFGELEKT